MHKDEIAKKSIKIVPLKESGEPAVVSIPISQANLLYPVTLRYLVVEYVFHM